MNVLLLFSDIVTVDMLPRGVTCRSLWVVVIFKVRTRSTDIQGGQFNRKPGALAALQYVKCLQ